MLKDNPYLTSCKHLYENSKMRKKILFIFIKDHLLISLVNTQQDLIFSYIIIKIINTKKNNKKKKEEIKFCK